MSATMADEHMAGPSAADFTQSFGEDIARALDLTTWRSGSDLTADFARIEEEVRKAVEREDGHQQAIRAQVLPRLKSAGQAPKHAGHYRANREEMGAVQRGLLFNGGVEACAGNVRVHDSLPLTMYQIGVSLVSYQGDQGTWCQRLFRRDLRHEVSDPCAAALQLLDGRAARAGGSDDLGELVHKTILAHAERAILLRRARGVWLMGQGNPAPYELLTGGGIMELMEAAINVLRELIEKHRKFVFVSSSPRDRLFLTIGHALRPWEYAIVSTLSQRLEHWLHQSRFAVGSKKLAWGRELVSAAEWIPRFIREVASQVVVGVLRASPVAPALVFYAHEDHADVAAHVVMADCMLQEHRGAPLLLDLARHVGQAVFGSTLDGLADSAYAKAGVPWRYRDAARVPNS